MAAEKFNNLQNLGQVRAIINAHADYINAMAEVIATWQVWASQVNSDISDIEAQVSALQFALDSLQGDYLSKTGLLQATGQSTDNAMSQKAATDNFALKGETGDVKVFQEDAATTANLRKIIIPDITDLNMLYGKTIFVQSSIDNTGAISIQINNLTIKGLEKVYASKTSLLATTTDLPKDWIYQISFSPSSDRFQLLNPPIQASTGNYTIYNDVYSSTGGIDIRSITVPGLTSADMVQGKIFNIHSTVANSKDVKLRIISGTGTILATIDLLKKKADGTTSVLSAGDLPLDWVYQAVLTKVNNQDVAIFQNPPIQASGGGGTGNPTVYNDAGTPTVRTVTIPDVSNFSDMEGKVYFIKSFANSAGSTTLNVNSYGGKQMLKFNQTANSPLTAGDLRQGMVYAITVLGNSIYVITPSIQIASNTAIGGVLIQNDPQGASGIPNVVGMQMFNQYKAAIQDQFGDLNALTLNMVYPQVINDLYAIGDPIYVPQSDYETLKDIERQYTIEDMQFYRQLIVKQINPYSGREICNKFDLVAYGSLPSDYNYEDPESHIDHYNLMGGLRQIVLDSDSPIWKGTLRDPYDTQWYTALIHIARVLTASDGEVRTWVITVYRNSGGGVMEFYRLLMPSFCPNPNGSPDMDNVDSFIGIKSPIYHRYRDVDYYAALKGDNTYDPDNRQYVPQPENIKSNGIPWDVQVYGVDDDVVRPTLTINEYLVWLGLYNALKFNLIYPQLIDV